MDFTEWRNRYKNRNDISSRLTHLTKGDTMDQAFEILIKILEDKKLLGSTTASGFIVGNKSAVCLQEAPIEAIAENLKYEKKLREETKCKIRYLAFGIRFSKVFIFRKGGRPVIYDEKEKLKTILPKEEYWRIMNYDIKNLNNMIDWTHEREWRVPGELAFDYKDIEIIVPSNSYYKKFIAYCLDNGREDIIKEVNGIIVLNSIYY